MIRRRAKLKRTGVTLVETIAAMTIIATLVAMALAAQSRLVRQWNDAELRITAADHADALLSQWWDLRPDLPHSAGGTVPGAPEWRWRTTPLDDAGLRREGLQTVRLLIYPPTSTGFGLEPLAQVDVLVRLKESEGAR